MSKLKKSKPRTWREQEERYAKAHPTPRLKALGNKVTKYSGLETFPAPKGLRKVTVISDEVTALCPVTGQPDQYTVEVEYQPARLCAESKTIKLFLQSYRNAGHFCEDFSRIIAAEFNKALKPVYVTCRVLQKPRGGVSILAESSFYRK